MIRTIKVIGYTCCMIFFLTGCSHKIKIDPSLDQIRTVKIEKEVNVNVGYFISRQDKIKNVITPGGGGDSVNYTPYLDTEAALNTVLSKIFNRVYSLESPHDQEYIDRKKIKYIFIPTITTQSSSASLFTWPPTNFIFELKCKAIDINHDIIWEELIYSEGYASFDEFKYNFSLSAQRATEKAFYIMMTKLQETNKFKED